jgi:2-polyprenyl-3-methyl-5-hydroxy-6-metoxy-1,4-benzoquinol methylase
MANADVNAARETATMLSPPVFDTDYVQWKSWGNAEFGQYSPLDSTYYAAEFGVGSLVHARALEIGFGNGSALAWLRDAGVDTYGVEANPTLIDRARRLLGGEKAFSDLEDATLSSLSGTFTHVIGLDVLEHVPMSSLPGMLCRVRTLLAPGGVAIFRFPNGDSPFGRLYQHGDPTHVTTLGSERIAYFARCARLEVASIRSPALPLHGVGPARALRRVLVRGMRQVIDRMVGQIYFGGRYISLDPNSIAVLVRPV